jgi:microcystin-dependent protein
MRQKNANNSPYKTGNTDTRQFPNQNGIEVLDQQAFMAIADDTAALVERIAQLEAQSGNSLPPGTYIQYAGTTAPSGFLACNGAAVSRTTYAQLFAVIGTTYGAGDGSTTFNLPDCRGLVFVGAGAHGTMTRANGTAYNGGSVGATRNDQFQSWQLGSNNDNSGSGRTVYAYAAEYGRASSSYDNIAHTTVQAGIGSPGSASRFRAFSDGTNGTPRAGDETRPAEIAVLVCIKY